MTRNEEITRDIGTAVLGVELKEWDVQDYTRVIEAMIGPMRALDELEFWSAAQNFFSRDDSQDWRNR
jgi:hypothetical protein